MKTVFSVLTLLVAVFAHAATFSRPNMNSADAATLAAALETAPNSENKAFVEIIMEINAKAPGSFAELSSIVDRVSDKYSLSQNSRIFYKKQFAYCNKKCRDLLRDAVAYCIANPSSYDRLYVTGARTAKFFTKEQIYTISVRCLSEYNLPPGGVLKLITAAVNASDVARPETVKADLGKLNRRYSLLLVKDKAAWTPVVQAIRTALETF